MRNMRRGHDAAFKAKVALEAVKREKTLAQLSSEFGIHTNQIRQWRKQLLEELPRLFSDRRRKEDRDREELLFELYQQIGQLKVELDWLKKNLRSSTEEKRTLVEPGYAMITFFFLTMGRGSIYPVFQQLKRDGLMINRGRKGSFVA